MALGKSAFYSFDLRLTDSFGGNNLCDRIRMASIETVRVFASSILSFAYFAIGRRQSGVPLCFDSFWSIYR